MPNKKPLVTYTITADNSLEETKLVLKTTCHGTRGNEKRMRISKTTTKAEILQKAVEKSPLIFEVSFCAMADAT